MHNSLCSRVFDLTSNHHQKLNSIDRIERAEAVKSIDARPSTIVHSIGISPENPLYVGELHYADKYILYPTMILKVSPALIGMSDKLVSKSLVKAHVSVPSPLYKFVVIFELSKT